MVARNPVSEVRPTATRSSRKLPQFLPADECQENRAQRDRIILEHHALVRTIALRISRRLPSCVEVDDLVNVGVLGLMDAVDRFDEARGASFKAYAEIRIRGAIVDSLRQADWVPLVVRRKVARIEGARGTLRQRLGREPGRAEIAVAMGISGEEYDDLASRSVIQRVVSLDTETDPEEGVSLAERVAGDTEHPMDRWIGEEAQDAMYGAIHRLPVMERDVLVLYYERGLKYREIGRTLGVCESRVCQLRAQAIGRVRRHVAAATA